MGSKFDNDEIFGTPADISAGNEEIRIHRQVPSKCKIAPIELQDDLRCSICAGFLRNAQTSQECPHSFCHECITQYLRQVNKQCPNCRVKLVSKRSLRPDAVLNAIVKSVYDDMDIFDDTNKLFLDIRKQQSHEASNVQKGIEKSLIETKSKPEEHSEPFTQPVPFYAKPGEKSFYFRFSPFPNQPEFPKFLNVYFIFHYEETKSNPFDALTTILVNVTLLNMNLKPKLRRLMNEEKLMVRFGEIAKYYIDTVGEGKEDDMIRLDEALSFQTLMEYQAEKKYSEIYTILPEEEEFTTLFFSVLPGSESE